MRERKPEREPAVWTTEEFEYTFGEKVRVRLVEIKAAYIIGFWELLTIVIVAMCINEKRSLEDFCLMIGVMLAMGVLTWMTLKPTWPATAWMKKTRAYLRQCEEDDGYYGH